MKDSQGRTLPLQVRVLDRWSDGSARWTLLDWLADYRPGRENQVELEAGSDIEPAPGQLRVEPSANGRRMEIDTGRARFRLAVGAPMPFAMVEADGVPIPTTPRSGLSALDHQDREYRAVVESMVVRETGPVRTEIRLGGRLLAANAEPLVDIETTLHFWSGSPTVRFEVAITNPRRASHPGGRWALGQRGSVYLRKATLAFDLPPSGGRTTIRCAPEIGSEWQETTGRFELYQDSSGGDNWDSRNHLNREGRVPNTFRGYRMCTAEVLSRGNRATPVVTVERGGQRLALAMRYFWQNFPKAIESSEETLAVALYPDQYADLHELQGGERKTHFLHVAFGDDEVADRPLEWCRAPLLAHAEPDWYAGSGAIPHLVPESRDSNVAYSDLVASAIEGDDSFEHKREVIDEYGWRNFGDVYADHEEAFCDGPRPVISHYNNQYDSIQGFAIQFMRSGDVRWHRMMDQLACHFTDIDVYHTKRDKAAYNGGHFWHTTHYTDAGTGTHRSFPPARGVRGGGPSGGHLYTSGLVLHYFLTGREVSRDVAVDAGRYVIEADDGSRTPFRHLDRGYTGVVSSSGDEWYHGPGRNPANSINALLEAHRLGEEQRFLDKAEQLIQRCIHPADDLEARNLLQAEDRWYYTMFLQTLGTYLDYKAERGELDAAYVYARAALLHYASWAERHEYPYLERPEILEFPTETWAAQDMRKSELFKFATLHSSGELRRRFLERARFFFDSSVAQLSRMKTRTLCRPVVLLLSLGYSQGYFDAHLESAAPTPRGSWSFGEPSEFVPQKARVKKKLVRLIVIGALALTALAVYLL